MVKWHKDVHGIPKYVYVDHVCVCVHSTSADVNVSQFTLVLTSHHDDNHATVDCSFLWQKSSLVSLQEHAS